MSNLSKRLISAAALIPCVLALIFAAPDWLFVSFIAMLAGLVGLEYGTMALRDHFRSFRLLVVAFSAASTLSLAFCGRFPMAPVLAFTLTVVLFPLMFMFRGGEMKGAVNAAASAAVGSLYAGILCGFLILVYRIQPAGSDWIFTLFAAAVLSDTGAYAGGRAFGRRKLFPRISPSKTWAGAVGGLLGTLAGIAFSKLFFLPSLSWPLAALLWLPLGASFQLGDLLESFLKRGFGVKDSGNLIPGHGGLFDRIDSLLLGAPMLYLFSMLR